MGRVDQSRVKSGFDAEALLGAPYLQIMLQTAFDAGMIPSEVELGGTRVLLSMLGPLYRLYDPAPLPAAGATRPESGEAFETEILFGHPLGARLRVRLMLGTDSIPPAAFDLYLRVDLVKESDGDGLASVGAAVGVVDVESTALEFIQSNHGYTKARVLASVQSRLDQTIDLGGASKFKRVEDLAIAWHEGDSAHAPALGLYINVRTRNGDEEDRFLPPRGDLGKALNFLPADEHMAMASRPGMYNDMADDVFSRTAVPHASGGFDHALRKSLLKPNSDRIGDLDSVTVGVIPPTEVNTWLPPVPQNGLRITVRGELIDPTDLTNTDLTFTIDVRPRVGTDGLLVWDTSFDLDVDALFEFAAIWAATLLGIFFGPYGALILLGVLFVAQLGVGIGVSIAKEGSVGERADAALADVIPDRLTITTRRWDPFYATLHQVVTRPSQAEFNAAGFMMCGKAIVGRQLVPPVGAVIRSETRDADGGIDGLLYFVPDAEIVRRDTDLLAPGTSRRDFTPPAEGEPELWRLSMTEFEQRRTDPDGPLVTTRIPYFPAAVHVKGNQIRSLLCISETEIKDVQDLIRSEAKQRGRDRILQFELQQITEEATAKLTAGGGQPTPEEIQAEIELRIEKKLKQVMDDYVSPDPLRLALSGSLQPHLSFDVTPEELVMLQRKHAILLDGATDVISGHRVETHLRDKPDPSDGSPGPEDNLLNRPRYRPSPAGPIFG